MSTAWEWIRPLSRVQTAQTARTWGPRLWPDHLCTCLAPLVVALRISGCTSPSGACRLLGQDRDLQSEPWGGSPDGPGPRALAATVGDSRDRAMDVTRH